MAVQVMSINLQAHGFDQSASGWVGCWTTAAGCIACITAGLVRPHHHTMQTHAHQIRQNQTGILNQRAKVLSNLSAVRQVADRFRGNLRGIVIAAYITALFGFGWFAAACVGW